MIWSTPPLRSFKYRGLRLVRWVYKTRVVWTRGLVAWGVGLSLSLVDTSDRFDLRFQMRGSQKMDSPFVLVYLNQSEWPAITGQIRNYLHPQKEVSAFTDSFYWDPSAWQKLLSNILQAQPSSIGVTLFFTLSSVGKIPDGKTYTALSDPRVVWAGRLDSDGRAALPAFVSVYGNNTGLIEFVSDEDRLVRRFSSPTVQVPHMSVRLALSHLTSRNHFPKNELELPNLVSGELWTINFNGPQDSYPILSAKEILENPQQYSEILKNKIVIIGTRDLDGHLYTTPVGPLSRAELVATISDNIIRNNWIERPHMWIVLAYLLLVVVIATAILRFYPQTVAIMFLLWLAIGITSGTLWIFDSHSIWIPLLAPLSEILVVYLIFVGYQLTVQENINWRLEEEKRYLREIEQLKNNFVSLFSHDLKTPIAKIQAICDRLMTLNPSHEIQSGLLSLREESSELHRYIQSILRVSRIESSDFKLNKEPTDINELIFNVCQQLKTLADAKNIHIDTNLEPIFAIDVDSTLIQEVILNLVENAIKYSSKNASVTISSREVSDQVIVTVTDSGPGIAPDEQSRIFEKFYRGTDHTLSTKGSGLGLYLVKYFVELHGGRVFVRSERSKGTRFGFVLPIETSEPFKNEPFFTPREITGETL